MKQFLPFFKIALVSLLLLVAEKTTAQNNFVARPATFVSADKPAAPSYSMSGILDGEGSTGLSSSVEGPNSGYFYWDKANNPVTFFINMNAASSISNMLFYRWWGDGEGVKNVTVRLYNASNTLVGTQNLVLPDGYPNRYLAAFNQRLSNITKVELVIVDGYNASAFNRTSLNEVVFGDTDCTTTPSTISAGTSQVLVVNTAIATPIQLATTTNTLGARITGLPAGLTGMWQSNKITISGTPTQTGVFNYTLSTGVGCESTTGTITVTTSACTTPPASVN